MLMATNRYGSIVYFYHDLLVMTLNSFNSITVIVMPQSVLWKYSMFYL